MMEAACIAFCGGKAMSQSHQNTGFLGEGEMASSAERPPNRSPGPFEQKQSRFV